MLVKVDSAALHGIEGVVVSVEVDVSRGLPSFTTVGLPDSSVRESKDRVKAAIKNCGYEVPPRKITVNLSPADLRKEGPSFDLPIALGLLTTTGIIQQEMVQGYLAVGELSLDGSLLPVVGILSIAMTAKTNGFKGLIIPRENAAEAQLAGPVEMIAVSNLFEIVEILTGVRPREQHRFEDSCTGTPVYEVELDDVRGQHSAKRALTIAAAGMHNLLTLYTI